MRATLNSATVNLAAVEEGPMKTATVAVLTKTTDTTVASVYVRQQQPWAFTAVGLLECHGLWGCPALAPPTGDELLDAATSCGLLVANMGSPRPVPMAPSS